MSSLTIEQYKDVEFTEGAIVLENGRLFPMPFPTSGFALWIGDSEVVYLDREEALVIAAALRGVALDG